MKITKPSRFLPGRLFLLLALFAAGAGCVTVDGEGDAGTSATSSGLPWTSFFRQPALLVADELVIEGPEDLLDHVAIMQDPMNIDYVTKTTEDGLLQELTVKEGRSRIEVRAQLDGWQVVAMKRMVILQRPGEVPVLVRAAGNAWWSTADGSEEKRNNRLEFRGDRGL